MTSGRKRRRGERRKSVRIFKGSILIVCEDSKCAPNYFKALKKAWHADLVDIEVVIHGKECGSDPIQVVNHAIDMYNDRKLEIRDPLSGKVQFDRVWCVFDNDNRETFRRALEIIKHKKFLSSAESDPCFELWYLCHFKVPRQNFHACSDVERSLIQEMPDFERKSAPIDRLLPLINAAMKNAGVLRQEIEENKNLDYSYTYIDLVVSDLRKLAR